MKQVTTIGLDIAKSTFQVHGVDAAGHMVLRQKLSRSRVLEFFAKLPRCLIGIEAPPRFRSFASRRLGCLEPSAHQTQDAA